MNNKNLENMSGFGEFLKAGASSLIGGTIEALGSIGAGRRQEERQKRLMIYQDKIADANYSKQLADQRQLIDEERAYNDFGSIMSRAAAAGVNPLYAIGAPSTGGNISTSTPSQGDPSIPGVSQDPQQVAFGAIGSAVTQSLDAAMKAEQLEQMRIKTKIDEKLLDYEDIRQKNESALSESQKTLNDRLAAESESNAKYKTALTKLTEAQTTWQDIVNSFEEDISLEKLTALQHQNNILDEQYDQLVKAGVYQEQDIISNLYLRYTVILDNLASVDLKKSQASTEIKRSKLLQTDIDNYDRVLKIKEDYNAAYKAYTEGRMSAENFRDITNSLSNAAMVAVRGYAAVKTKGATEGMKYNGDRRLSNGAEDWLNERGYTSGVL